MVPLLGDGAHERCNRQKSEREVAGLLQILVTCIELAMGMRQRERAVSPRALGRCLGPPPFTSRIYAKLQARCKTRWSWHRAHYDLPVSGQHILLA